MSKRDYFYEVELQEKVLEQIEKNYGSNVWILKTCELVRVGVPDIIICFFGHFVAIELKRKHKPRIRKPTATERVGMRREKEEVLGSLSIEEQKKFPLQFYNIKKINAAGGSAFFGREVGWIMDRLERIRRSIDPLTMRVEIDLEHEEHLKAQIEFEKKIKRKEVE